MLPDLKTVFNSEIGNYPQALCSHLEQLWQRYSELDVDILSVLHLHNPLILRAFAVSDFLAETILKHPADTSKWLSSPELSYGYSIDKKVLSSRLDTLLSGCTSENELHRQLRLFRRAQMFAIYWKDLVLRESFENTARHVSWLAEVCIDGAIKWLMPELSKQFGVPRRKSGQPQSLIVLGMGKLGATELNVSSDIDLIFAFPEHGETTDGPRAIDNQIFFTRLGQKLIQALDNVTADGFVFRVDMRLRPYGQSGALALSFAAMEEYYEDQGRDWERYAMIKAAPVAGDLVQGRRLMKALNPFIYRKYIDFGAIDSLRAMKEMIEREVLRKGIGHNIKLGSGGIREVEFIAQVFQLIRGGRDINLQCRGLLEVLEVIRTEQLMPGKVVDELRDAYIFLRNLEHAVQGLGDKQTQQIPTDELSRERIAVAMGYAGWDECEKTMTVHRKHVSCHFADVIATPQTKGRVEDDVKIWQLLWLGELEESEVADIFSEQGCSGPQEYARQLLAFKAGSKVQHLQAQGKERLAVFMPRLLMLAVEMNASADTLARLLEFVEAVLRRSAYISLLIENPAALDELVRLFGESRWVGEQIVRMPLLLDELLHSESLYSPPDVATLSDELRQEMLRIPQDDLEEQMEVLRYFKRAHVLRVAASDIRGSLPLMKVSDYLTFIAETIVGQVLEQGWQAMIAKYGRPRRDDGEVADQDFGIVGYGKLGGIELSYGSDLDLVFLHDGGAYQATDGEHSIDNQVFYTRLGQRVIHLLNTKTASGDIYEVDMRLRPSGNSGLLVSSVESWRRYQEEQAWTWEHQALVRARYVAGNELIRHKFESARLEVLTMPRDTEKLRTEVLEMRDKMRAALATPPNSNGELPYFDIKHDPGGIVDIEFMVQYAALRWAHKYPSVVRWSDNIRILESLAECGLMNREDSELLCEIYRQYRARGHRLALQNLPVQVANEEFLEARQQVSELWRQMFEL